MPIMEPHSDQPKAPESKPAQDEVAKKAYAIYLKEGRPQGRDVQNWLEAETQMSRAETKPASAKLANATPPDIASVSVPDTLAALHVNPETGLTRAEVDARLKEHGYNEVAERKEHPVLRFLGKFWGLSVDA